jgi:hypothetical protein
VRQTHRATQLGGPTTEGEPSFVEYYQRHYHKLPPDEFIAQVDEEDLDYTASDGQVVTGQTALQEYEKLIARRPSERLDNRLASVDADFDKFVDHGDSKGKLRNQSISDMLGDTE